MREKDESRREPFLGPLAEGGEAALVAFADGVDRGLVRGGKEVPGLGALGSLSFHLALLLALLLSPLTPRAPPVSPPIPVRLLVVRPPPKPAQRPLPKPEKKPPAGRLASVSMGEKAQRPAKEGEPPLAKPAPPPSAAKPEKKPAPAEAGAPPKPLESAMAVPLPLEKPPAPPQTRSSPPRRRPLPRRTPGPARAEPLPEYPGPSATRSAYLAYLAALTREHIGLLTRSMVGDRHGLTVIGITVRDDGTIGHLEVLKSSGYPDIDRRVEMMVAAVERFPPLPQFWQGPQAELQFLLSFPDALPK